MPCAPRMDRTSGERQPAERAPAAAASPAATSGQAPPVPPRRGRGPPRSPRRPPAAGRGCPETGRASTNAWSSPATTEIHAASAIRATSAGSVSRTAALIGAITSCSAVRQWPSIDARRAANPACPGPCQRRAPPAGPPRPRRRRRPARSSRRSAPTNGRGSRAVSTSTVVPGRTVRAATTSSRSNGIGRVRRQPREQVEHALGLARRGRDRHRRDPGLRARCSRPR